MFWKEELKEQLPKNAKVMLSTWAMKKKANGTYQARVNVRGFEQRNRIQFDKEDKAAPVICDVTIWITLTWTVHIMDVHGAFLLGEFKDGETIYMKVPQGFEKCYPENVVLKLLKTIYGLQQAAMAFWRETLKAFKHMGYNQSKANQYLFFKRTRTGLVIWLSWVNNFLVCGNKEAVKEAKKTMNELFDCDDQGLMQEYVGCKVDKNWDKPSMKLTQPVMLQSFEDEFDLSEAGKSNTPSVPGSKLSKNNDECPIPPSALETYHLGVGKLLHMMQWT